MSRIIGAGCGDLNRGGLAAGLPICLKRGNDAKCVRQRNARTSELPVPLQMIAAE
jgi:hypothetical protein